MDLHQRSAIRQFLFASSGAIFIPGSMQDDGKPTIVLDNISLTRSDESLLAAFCDVLLPSGETPGALDIGAHYFVMKKLDQLDSVADQQKYVRGLRHLNTMAAERFGKRFIACSGEQRLALLKMVDSQRLVPSDLKACYATVKQLTMQAYISSEYYLSEVFEYRPMGVTI